MDLWLESQGYYRKLTARDGSCLFRAVSEQIYFTQKFHMDIRRRCTEYMQEHLELFDGLDIDGGIEVYLEHLRNPLQWGSHLEVIALSHLYKIDIVIFKEVGVAAEKAAETHFGKKVMLCFSHERHYDSVYLKEFTKVAGFCQSLMYDMLYKNVFGMKDVDYAVDKMLHYKPLRHRGESGGPRKFFSYSCNSIQLQRKGIMAESLLDDGEVNVRDLLMKGVTPFPYKVAKSLDPNIFRNVEFDVWIDYRRGLRQGFFGTNHELQVGVKCLVKIEENTHVGHIQEMAPDKGPVIVFVEELGEKRTVPYESLELLPQEPLAPKQISVSSNLKDLLKSGSASEGFGGGKSRKGRLDIESKGKNGIQLSLSPMRRRRNNSKSDQSSNTDNNSTDNLRTCDIYPDTNIMTSFDDFSVDGYNPNSGYAPYQLKPTVELSMTVPIQTHVLMSSQQHSNPHILIPVSPRPEDVPAHWLSDVQGSAEVSLSPTGGDFQFLSHTAVGANLPENSQEISDPSKDVLSSNVMDDNAGYLPQEPQINYNAPKSIMDDGTDLPISDIQTLRFFYNLGNDVYRAQYSMQYGWGGYAQPCTVTSPSTPTTPGMCSGKCLCGPVCITTVPTIHRLLEPTTPPSNSRRKRRDSAGATSVVANEGIDSSSTSASSQPSPTTSSTPLASVPPRFRAKGKGKKDPKAYEGQPLVHQPTLQIPSTDESVTNEQNSGSTMNSSHTPPTLSIPFSPPYSYVYYPTSPVVPFSPVESDPYFTPLRLQFPTDYMPDTPQSPQCFSVNGDVGVYGSSTQYSMMATSPHYLVPASPGIYVGSPPAWSPLTP